MGCEIKYGGTNESTNILHISVRVTCTVKFSAKKFSAGRGQIPSLSPHPIYKWDR